MLIYTVFYSYVCAVIFLTLLPFPLEWDPKNFDGDIGNFIPFRDLRYGYNGALKDIVLNIIMTIPFGILFPQLSKAKCIATVLLGFSISTLIECVQLLMTLLGSNIHSFDITDIITNTAGALIGYLIWLQLDRICKGPET